MKMAPSFLKNIYLMILLNDSTKHALAGITVIFTELFETDSIRGSLNERFTVFS